MLRKYQPASPRRRFLRAAAMSMAVVAAMTGAGVLGMTRDAAASPAAGGEEAQEARLALAAPHSLLEAVKAVAARDGARVFDAALETRDGKLVYEIRAMLGDGTQVFVVDPDTGAITSQETPSLLDRVMGDVDDDGDEVSAAKTDMAAAIVAAEEAAGGRAMEAQLETDDDGGMPPAGPIWAVRVASADGAVAMAAIDAGTGGVLATGPAEDDD